MAIPTVSVIIPVYKGAKFIGEAIQSVLAQTCSDFELIIVNDASPDNSREVIRQYSDPRLRYIEHEFNQGSDVARLTGLGASSGQLIIFLDQDDFLHPEKLELHVAYFKQHPDVGVTYNARFEYEDWNKSIRGIWSPPEPLTLADLILGFPFAPSDTVMTRAWALREEIWDDSFMTRGDEVIFNGAEIVFYGRLYLAGCKFGRVDKILNYRRHHAQRVLSDLDKRCKSELACQKIMLSDPRTPQAVQDLRSTAFFNTYIIWAYFAFFQKENGLGKTYLREAAKYNPALGNGNPSELSRFIAYYSNTDSSQNIEDFAGRFFNNLPEELSHISAQFNWAVAYSYLQKGVNTFIWGEKENAQQYFEQAQKFGAQIDNDFLHKLAHDLIYHSQAFGSEATQKTLNELTIPIQKFINPQATRRIKASYAIDHAFYSYQRNNYAVVPQKVIEAILNEPSYLFNKGVWSIFIRSVVK